MKINFIGSKTDLIAGLKKAAQIGNIDQLGKLAQHIQEESTLDNLLDQVHYEAYRTTVQEDAFIIERVKMSYDPLKNLWKEDDCTVVEKIPFVSLDKEQ